MRPRVTTAALGRWVDPEAAYLALVGDRDDAFWLDSGIEATTGVSYLGLASEVIAEFTGPVLERLRDELAAWNVDTADAPPGFALGWVGWLGYELRGETMGVPVTRLPREPLAAWLRVERALAFDHARRDVTLLALDGDLEPWRAEVEAALATGAAGTAVPVAELVEAPDRGTSSGPFDKLRDRDASTRAAGPDAVAELVEAPDLGTSSGPFDRLRDRDALRDREPPRVTWAYADAEYLDLIRACQRSIRDGDAYQLCLTTEARVGIRPDPVATYLALRRSSPTHHGALLRARGVSLLSASPERFLSVSPRGVVETSPIKGTRPRHPDPGRDAALRSELEASDKERAENLMIVDLMRNDLSRICEVGSVEVTSLLAVESYAHVHQLVSTVRGRLAPGLTGIDAIAACFPAGSMTGAPKRSATEILDRLERRPRGIYSGAFGYLGLDGAVDLAMVIRSIVIDGEGCTIGTGGGITALSVPEEELEETRVKAAALLRVLGVGSVPARAAAGGV